MDFQGKLFETVAVTALDSLYHGLIGTLHTKRLNNLYLGNIQRELKLNFDEGTEVFYSCGATLNGQHWILGGYTERKQVGYC